MHKKVPFWIFIFTLILAFVHVNAQKYEPNWRSVRQIKTPQWLQDGKFGIYTHWGPYAVHAYGSNTTWYAYSVYQPKLQGSREQAELLHEGGDHGY